MFSHADVPAPAARDDVVDGEARVGLAAAVLARPEVAGEHRLAGDLPPVHVARDPDVAHEPDHAGPRHLEPLGAKRSLAGLEHLRALLEDEHRGPAHRADVDGLVGGVEDEDTRARALRRESHRGVARWSAPEASCAGIGRRSRPARGSPLVTG